MGVTPPSAVTLTIIDDDATPMITTASPILVAENETEVATLAATDADDRMEDLEWEITAGLDRNAFTLTAAGGLAFASAKDFENPDDANGDGDYEVTVRVSDGANLAEAGFTVRLQDVDDTAPMLLSAVVNGTTLTLTYDEPLDGSSAPVPEDFTVDGGDQTRTVTGVRVNGSAVGTDPGCGGRALGGRDPGELHAGDEPDPGRAGQRGGGAEPRAGDERNTGYDGTGGEQSGHHLEPGIQSNLCSGGRDRGDGDLR